MMGEDDFKTRRNISIGAFMLGFGSACYFIFAFYSLAIFLIFVLIGQKGDRLKKICFFALFFIVGYSPFLYGHMSILIQQGFHQYVAWLKTLDNYGISNGASVSLFSKIKYFFTMLESLAGGDRIVLYITGASALKIYHLFARFFFIIFCFSGLVSIPILVLEFKSRKEKFPAAVLLMLVLNAMFFFHFLLALVVGTALGYQHYIMLIPLIYLHISTTSFYLIKKHLSKMQGGERREIAKKVTYAILCLLSCLSFLQDEKGIKLIKSGFGSGYYSTEVTDLANFLKNSVGTDDVILCPQWGYWMGMSVIQGGEKKIWNSTEESTLQFNLESQNPSGLLYCVLDSKTDKNMLENFFSKNNYSLKKTVNFLKSDKDISVNIYKKDFSNLVSKLDFAGENFVILSGQYEDKWLSGKCSIALKNAEKRNLILTFYNPSPASPQKIQVLANGEIVSSLAIKSGLWEAKISGDIMEEKLLLELSTDYLQPKTGQDERNLSLILSNIRFE